MSELNSMQAKEAREAFSIDATGSIKVRYWQKEIGEEERLVVCFSRGLEGIRKHICNLALATEQALGGESGYLRYCSHAFPKSSEEDFFRIAYGFPRSLKPLSDLLCDWPGKNLWAMNQVVATLENIYGLDLDEGNFLGKEAIFIDESEEKAIIGFCGLADLFRKYGVGPWKDRVRPDKGDDLHNLLSCFKKKLQEMKLSAALKYIKSPDNKDLDSLKKLKDEMLLREEFHRRKDKVYLKFGKTRCPNEETIRALIDDINRGCTFSSCTMPLLQGIATARKDGLSNVKKMINEGRVTINGNPATCKSKYRKDDLVKVDDKDLEMPEKKRLTGEKHSCVALVKNPMHYLVEEVSGSKYFDLKHLTRKHYVRWKEPNLPEESAGYVAILENQKKAAESIARLPKENLKQLEKKKFKRKFICRWEINDKHDPGGVLFWFLLDADYDSESIVSEINELKMKKKEKDLEILEILKIHFYYRNLRQNADKAGYLRDINDSAFFITLDCKPPDKPPEGKSLQIGKELIKKERFMIFKRKRSGQDEFEFFLVVLAKSGISIGNPKKVKLDNREIEVRELKRKYAICTKPDADKREKGSAIPRLQPGNLEENIEKERITYERQIEAAHRLAVFEFENKKLCEIIANPKNIRCHDVDFDKPIKMFDEKLNKDKGQQRAIKLALFTKSPICLIHGPPGTGKTQVIVEIIRQLVFMNEKIRILICSQTNTAVENVMERIENIDSVKAVHLVAKERLDKAKNPLPLTIDGQFKKLFKNTATKGDLPVEIAKQWNLFCSKTTSNWSNCGNHSQKIYYPIIKEGGTHKYINPKEAFLRNANVIGGTCIHIASGAYGDIFKGKFDWVIMDEASKATSAEALVPLQFAQKAVLVGDHKQLPPFIDKEIEDDLEKEKEENNDHEKHEESLFEKYVKMKEWEKCTVMLNNQRRMTRQIGDLVSKFFYDSALKTPPAHANQPNLIMKKGKPSLVFIDTSHIEKKPNNEAKVGTSRINECNAEVVIETLRALNKYLEASKKVEKVAVAVVSAYTGQVNSLYDKIDRKEFNCIEISKGRPATVDSFQGREAPIVIYDIVRGSGGIGFLDEPRRLNVAFSRAKWLFVIIGDKKFLQKAEPCEKRKSDGEKRALLGDIVEYLDEQGLCFRSIEEVLNEK